MKCDCMAEVNNKSRSSLLLVTYAIHNNPTGGRDLLCKLNSDVLRKLYGSHLYIYELQRSRLRGVKQQYKAFRGHIDGINATSIEDVCALVRHKNIQQVFLDGSNLGAMIEALKRCFNNVVVTTFFHNVEARFFWGSFTATKSIRSLGRWTALRMCSALLWR